MSITNSVFVGRSDYAGNAGTGNSNTNWKGSGADNYSQAQWETVDGILGANGVITRRSTCPVGLIRDGTSNTYLIGERNLDPQHYNDGRYYANDQGWNLAYDYDVARWGTYAPVQDSPGKGNGRAFGGVHSVGFLMVMCDGSVRTISFTVALTAHKNLSNRSDGEVIDIDLL